MARMFRSGAATGNYLGQDRPDAQFAVKEVCRGRAMPTEKALVKVLARRA